MTKNHIISSLVLFVLGMGIFLLPIRAYDHLRIRYILGLWLFAEAAYNIVASERMATPLYQLVGRFQTMRDKVVGSVALAAFFVILFLSVRYLMENDVFWVAKLFLAVGALLFTWLIYYGICFLFGTDELRNGILPKFVRRWLHLLESKADKK